MRILTYAVGLFVLADQCTALLSSAHQTLFTNNGWTITVDGNDYKFRHTGVVDGNTYTVGSFPNADNPNRIQVQDYTIYVPKNPAKQASTSCTGRGYIGMAVNGAVFFNPLTSEDKDAVSGECAETFDDCQGHPDSFGVYHYHQNPSCVTTGANDEPVGIALDGFLIYQSVDENGNQLTSADLDTCGGRTSSAGSQYQYHLQTTYPYTIGCYSGSLSPRQNVNTECNSLVTCSMASSSAVCSLIFMVVCLAITRFLRVTRYTL